MNNEYEEKEYRKLPVVIKARRMREPFTVETLEGTMRGQAGDWLLTGVDGEQYPCADAIFRRTYEAVELTPEAGRRVWTIVDTDGDLAGVGFAPPTRELIKSTWAYEGNDRIVIREHGPGAVIYRGHAHDFDEDVDPRA